MEADEANFDKLNGDQTIQKKQFYAGEMEDDPEEDEEE